MTLLSKKSWHVGNQDNVARVAKDEQEASTVAEQRRLASAQAARDARWEALRAQADAREAAERHRGLPARSLDQWRNRPILHLLLGF